MSRDKEKKRMIMDINSSIDTKNNKMNTRIIYYTDCLKEIVNKKKSLYIFFKWFSSLLNELETKNINIFDYLSNIYFLNNDEDMSTEFFNYVFKIYNTAKYYNNQNYSKFCKIAEYIYNFNKLNSICFITPEIGISSNENKIGLILDELSQGLIDLGQEVIIISPYYHSDKLKNIPLNNLQKITQMSIELDKDYIFDIYLGEKNKIKYYFIYNSNLFQAPHSNISGEENIREISCFSKASLQLLSNLNIFPDVIITNGPYTGFIAAYAKNNPSNYIFKNSKFIHIINNIEMEKQGRIYLPLKEGTYENIHQLPNDLVLDPYDKRLLNPTSCAVRMSDQLIALSKSYKNNLSKNCDIFNIFNLLKQKKNIFYLTSGISKDDRYKIIKYGLNKDEAKRIIQKKYFNYKIYNPKVPLYTFIGKLNEQNGALLLIDILEKLFKIANRNINILIIAYGDTNEPYYQECIKRINYLKKNFPYCIYAESNKFFKENINLIFKASDFGLIPFLFDNWINLHIKYFTAGTPVVAYDVGHIKDTVKEFNFVNKTGNGFLFDHFNSNEFYLAVKTSLELFKNKSLLEICRKNCEDSVIGIDEICIDLCRELYRLKNKIFFNSKKVYDDYIYNLNLEKERNINKSSTKLKNKNKNNDININNIFIYNYYYEIFKDCNSANKVKSTCKNVLYDSNHFLVDFSNFGKNVNKVSSCKSCMRKNNNNDISNYNDDDLYTISYKLDYPKPEKVQITGSYDNWSTLKDLTYNKKSKKWEIDLNLKKGKYYYKFLLDDKCWKVDPLEHYHKDYNGIVNNVLYIY